METLHDGTPLTPEQIIEELKKLTEGERIKFFHLFIDNWCRGCGGEKYCCCWNDE